MDTLTLVAIVLLVLLLIGALGVLIRRRQASSLGRLPLSLDDPAVTTSPVRSNRAAMPVQNASAPLPGVNITPLASADLSDVSLLMQQGNKIQAIKRLRELTGLGLKEAKDYVEALPLSAPPNQPISTRQLAANLAAPDLAEVSALLARGSKIEAIKRLRELTGLGLKEAKDYVEAMPNVGVLPALPSTSSAPQSGEGDVAEVHALAQQGRKIEAIKRYRQLTGVGLKEAKDYVDRL